jgi:hypothetical protein
VFEGEDFGINKKLGRFISFKKLKDKDNSIEKRD